MNMQRLDLRVHELYPQYSRRWIQEVITQGHVSVDGKIVTKVSYQVSSEQLIEVTFPEQKYVSRSGYKLEQALEEFHLDVTGLVALDAGLSTGGFTDCLLQHNIARVYGIDVGTAQVHDKIKQNEKVTVCEQTDIRDAKRIVDKVDIVTLDLSFISVLKVIEAVACLLQGGGMLIVLIKPQFEVGKAYIGRTGVVKNETVKNKAVQQVIDGIASQGFTFIQATTAKVQGADGNKEILALFIKK